MIKGSEFISNISSHRQPLNDGARLPRTSTDQCSKQAADSESQQSDFFIWGSDVGHLGGRGGIERVEAAESRCLSVDKGTCGGRGVCVANVTSQAIAKTLTKSARAC